MIELKNKKILLFNLSFKYINNLKFNYNYKYIIILLSIILFEYQSNIFI